MEETHADWSMTPAGRTMQWKQTQSSGYYLGTHPRFSVIFCFLAWHGVERAEFSSHLCLDLGNNGPGRPKMPKEEVECRRGKRRRRKMIKSPLDDQPSPAESVLVVASWPLFALLGSSLSTRGSMVRADAPPLGCQSSLAKSSLWHPVLQVNTA